MDSKPKGKSNLNPNAAPFVPSSKSLSSRPSNPNPPRIEDVPKETQGSTDSAAQHMLPDSISFDFEGEMSDEQRVVENISNMYPEIPMDFIIEFAGAHGYDFDLTVDMLEQFYVSQGETSESQDDVGTDPQKARPSGST